MKTLRYRLNNTLNTAKLSKLDAKKLSGMQFRDKIGKQLLGVGGQLRHGRQCCNGVKK